jgi:hypothetical protein
MGYTNVRHFHRGLSTWIEAGGAVESGAPQKLEAGRPSESAAPSMPAPVMPAAVVRRVATPARRGGWTSRLIEGITAISLGRLVGLWIVVAVACGVLYWGAGAAIGPVLYHGVAPIPATVGGLLSAIYFSFVTATSIGFGDIVPVGPARILAVLEGASGLLLLGAMISKLVSRRQDQLLEETHRIAYEARLGRVRTNLHLVLSEIQSMSADCGTGVLAPERLLPRFESAAMVFGGELRAIHDLLYRPQRNPSEPELEALLANLAAGMREMSELLRTMPGVTDRSTILRSGLSSISLLASEICGECVPREYAPELKGLMDEVQRLARQLEPSSLRASPAAHPA